MKKQQLTDLKYLFWTILSGVLHAFALSSFSTPHGLYPSGFSGVSRLLSDVGRDYLGVNIPFYTPYLLLNSIAILLVYKYIGKKFTIFSIIQIVTTSFLVGVLPVVHFVDDMLLISVFGGILSGFGISLALQHNSSSGGTDFFAMYFSAKYKRSTWSYVLYFNAAVLIIAGFLYGWEKALYSIIYQFCSTTIVNRIHDRYTHQTIMIITKKKDEVIRSILDGTRHGITVSRAEGAYLHQEEWKLYMVVNSFETEAVVRSVLKEDPKAFINIQESTRVVGNFYQKPLD